MSDKIRARCTLCNDRYNYDREEYTPYCETCTAWLGSEKAPMLEWLVKVIQAQVEKAIDDHVDSGYHTDRQWS